MNYKVRIINWYFFYIEIFIILQVLLYKNEHCYLLLTHVASLVIVSYLYAQWKNCIKSSNTSVTNRNWNSYSLNKCEQHNEDFKKWIKSILISCYFATCDLSLFLHQLEGSLTWEDCVALITFEIWYVIQPSFYFHTLSHPSTHYLLFFSVVSFRGDIYQHSFVQT